jgi:hypothetical protein
MNRMKTIHKLALAALAGVLIGITIDGDSKHLAKCSGIHVL